MQKIHRSNLSVYKNYADPYPPSLAAPIRERVSRNLDLIYMQIVYYCHYL